MQHFARSQAWDLVNKCNPPVSAMQQVCESRPSRFISLSATHVIYVMLFVAENDQHNVAVVAQICFTHTILISSQTSICAQY